jgi:hypothetical protein
MTDPKQSTDVEPGTVLAKAVLSASSPDPTEAPAPPPNVPEITAGVGSDASVGLDPVAFGDALILRSLNRDALLKWVQANLVERTDYGTIPGGAKPSLWQPGAQKICGMLSLRPFFPDVEKYVDRCVAGEVIDEVLVRCYLYDAHGNCVAQGTGARSAIREKGIYGKDADGRRTRTGTDEYRDLNYAIKMSQKSAHIDATNRASGLSAIFTQDRPAEDQDITPIKGKPEEGYLLQLSGELFGIDEANGVLESLALRRFQIKDGDWTQIPISRLSYAVSSLREKAVTDGIGESA